MAHSPKVTPLAPDGNAPPNTFVIRDVNAYLFEPVEDTTRYSGIEGLTRMFFDQCMNSGMFSAIHTQRLQRAFLLLSQPMKPIPGIIGKWLVSGQTVVIDRIFQKKSDTPESGLAVPSNRLAHLLFLFD